MMKEFFKVKTIDQALEYAVQFPRMASEKASLTDSVGRILAEDIKSDINLPDFSRSIMDGYAVRGSSTFGAAEGNPAFLNITGTVSMGNKPDLCVGPGEAVRISTGGMLPPDADSVVMVEHEVILRCGGKIRPQEAGMLAALGKQTVPVYKKPLIGIISTGDEVVAVDESPGPGQIRDVNTYTLSGLIQEIGATPIPFGIVRDDYEALLAKSSQALAQCDIVLVSGGSSVGARDFTIDVITALEDSEILFHGISISPGKPTILARVQKKAFWGLPGHVVSAMVVFSRIVKPFTEHVSGCADAYRKKIRLTAKLSRNLASAQGRVEFIRIRLKQKEGVLWAEPILGKSGLISTMVKADGLIEIGMNTEGIDEGAQVEVILV